MNFKKNLGNYQVTIKPSNQPIFLQDINDYFDIIHIAEGSEFMQKLYLESAILDFERLTKIPIMNRTVKASFYGFHNFKFFTPYGSWFWNENGFMNFGTLSRANAVNNHYFPLITLYYGNIQHINSIKYKVHSKTGIEWREVKPEHYTLDKQRCYSTIHFHKNFYNECGFNVIPYNVDQDSVQVEFVAGLGETASDIPRNIIMALLGMVRSFWEARYSCDCNTSGAKSFPDDVISAMSTYSCSLTYHML